MKNLSLPLRNEAISLAKQAIAANLFIGLTTKDHLDIDSEESVYRFNYQKLKDWHFEEEIAPVNDKMDKSVSLSEISKSQSSLTQRDWTLILTGSIVEKFKKMKSLLNKIAKILNFIKLKKAKSRLKKQLLMEQQKFLLE